jgi:hypothetical protein
VPPALDAVAPRAQSANKNAIERRFIHLGMRTR